MDVRKLPAVADRVESGPIQFGDDWPGLFLRGDSAFAFAIELLHYLQFTKNVEKKHRVSSHVLVTLAEELLSCQTNQELATEMLESFRRVNVSERTLTLRDLILQDPEVEA